MTRLVWGAAGERLYEAGIDRGVLFVGSNPGVAWNGLTAVNETPTGAEAEPAYFEGYKYSNRQTPEEFEATIEAYTYPNEFAICDGTGSMGFGVFLSQQRRRAFSLAYRTKVGNDIKALDYAYKIHLLYNLKASPTSKNYASVNNSPSPLNFSWKVTARPSRAEGFKPTAHVVLDSRQTPKDFLSDLEDVLYGTSSTPPRMPSLVELSYRLSVLTLGRHDAKGPSDPQYVTVDAGSLSEPYTTTLDGGQP